MSRSTVAAKVKCHGVPWPPLRSLAVRDHAQLLSEIAPREITV